MIICQGPLTLANEEDDRPTHFFYDQVRIARILNQMNLSAEADAVEVISHQDYTNVVVNCSFSQAWDNCMDSYYDVIQHIGSAAETFLEEEMNGLI